MEEYGFLKLCCEHPEYQVVVDESRQKVRKAIEQLTLFDDELMSKVFDNNIPATQLLVKLILQREDIQVVSVTGQKELKSPVTGGRNLRLDIHALDENGKEIDIEVQRSIPGADYRRARLHSSMLDARMLKSGEEFSALPDSYVIFITEKDIPDLGLPLYHIERIIRETGAPVDDGAYTVYVNGSYTGDDPLGDLVHDFRCTKSKDMNYPELADGLKHFKETEEGVNTMCQVFEELANERARKIADISRAEGISIGEARGEANAKKKYEAQIAEMQAELAKYKAALKQ